MQNFQYIYIFNIGAYAVKRVTITDVFITKSFLKKL